jgi:hypothetical protein
MRTAIGSGRIVGALAAVALLGSAATPGLAQSRSFKLVCTNDSGTSVYYALDLDRGTVAGEDGAVAPLQVTDAYYQFKLPNVWSTIRIDRTSGKWHIWSNLQTWENPHNFVCRRSGPGI